MPLTHYLKASRVCVLNGRTAQLAIEELAGLICNDRSDLAQADIINAALARERDISTQVAPQLAIPHARLPGVGAPVLAVGVSRDGIMWGGSAAQNVHVVMLLLGDETDPQAMLETLATLARAFQHNDAILDILAAETHGDLVERLTHHTCLDSAGPDAPVDDAISRLYSAAVGLADRAEVKCLLLMSEHRVDLGFVKTMRPSCTTLYVTNPWRQLNAPEMPFDQVIQIPMRGMSQRHALDLAMLMAISRDIVGLDDSVVCVYDSSGSGRLDTVSLLSVRDDMRIPQSLHEELESGDINFQVLLRVFTLATELAQEGREGKSIGTLFVLGDHEAVQEHCSQLVINPFKGYSDEEKNILDPSLAETVKEFAHIDGAFTVRGDGVIQSAGTYIRSEVIGDQLEGGLGARHAAGQAITAQTQALSLVLSESTGAITLYRNGSSVLSLKRDSG